MKQALILIVTVITVFVAGSKAQYPKNTFVFSISPGIIQSGVILSMEGGLWPIQGRIGVMAGGLIYDENVSTTKGKERITQIDASGRVIYKLTKIGSNHPQLVTGFATLRGLVGATYRAYTSVGQYTLIGIEPGYINRLGASVNVLITARL